MAYLSSIRLFTSETYGKDKFMKEICLFSLSLPLLLLTLCKSKEQKINETCLLESRTDQHPRSDDTIEH